MTDNKCSECSQASCSARERRPGESEEQHGERLALRLQMCGIETKIVVLSGKGGVGKSTFAVNLAMSMALDGRKVGVLDVDVHGPSVPRLLGLSGTGIETRNGKIIPLGYEGLKVMSVGFLLSKPDDPVIWRGPMKYGVIKQFLSDVDWGGIDTLIVDCPPGTGDEPLSVVQLIEDVTGAVVVTTPQEVALDDVRKSISFCKRLDVPVLGVVENMSGFVCPGCGERVDIFSTGSCEKMADEMGVPFAGKIPIEPQIAKASDEGKPYMYFYSETETARNMKRIMSRLQASRKDVEG